MGTIIAGAFGASAYYVGKSKDVEHAVVKERELREKDKEYLEKLLMAESRAANVQAVKEIYEKFSVLASGAEYEEMRKRVKDVIAPPPPTPTSK